MGVDCAAGVRRAKHSCQIIVHLRGVAALVRHRRATSIDFNTAAVVIAAEIIARKVERGKLPFP